MEADKKSLISKFKLSEIQASHILDMPLRRLTALGKRKLRRTKKKELQKKQIKDLNKTNN